MSTTNDENPEKDQDLERLDDACRKLGEHYDTVRIFATRHDYEKKQTVHCSRGTGNWYAQYGGIVEWMTKQDEGAREDYRNSDE